MSRPKGGEGASDCVADVLGKVLDVHILIWKMPLDAYQVAVTASRSSAPAYACTIADRGARVHMTTATLTVLTTHASHLPYMEAMA